jgi:beta-glucosidase
MLAITSLCGNTFKLDREAFAPWDKDMQRMVEPGEFTIYAGANSVDLEQKTLTVAQ